MKMKFPPVFLEFYVGRDIFNDKTVHTIVKKEETRK